MRKTMITFFLFFIFSDLSAFESRLYEHPAMRMQVAVNLSDNNVYHSHIRADYTHSHVSNSFLVDYAYCSVADFQRIFAHMTEEEILGNYELFSLANFQTYACALSGYDDFILSLEAKIKSDKQLRKQTAYIQGFSYHFGFRGEESGFHNFIFEQANKIRKKQSRRNSHACKGVLYIHDARVLDQLEKQWLSRRKFAVDFSRLNERLDVVQISRITHGIELDRQLRKELSETCKTMKQLEHNFRSNHHVRMIAPFVYQHASQAKREHCPIIAFGLSDFCYAVTQLLSYGMHVLYDSGYAVGKGICSGVQTVASVEHWKDMATGILHMGFLVAESIGHEEDSHYAIARALFSEEPDIVMQFSKKYCEQTQEQKEMLSRCAHHTYERIKSMSWQEILENGTEIGVTMVLDTLALHTLSGFTRITSNALVKEISRAVESGALLQESYAAEIAGFGKLIIEEGTDVAVEAMEIANNLIPSQSCWKATNFAMGKLEKHFMKHVVKNSEWGKNVIMTLDEYLSKARLLLNSEVADHIEGFISKDGWIFKYNKLTNEFATAKPDGTIETLFCPENGLEYWTNQVKKYK